MTASHLWSADINSGGARTPNGKSYSCRSHPTLPRSIQPTSKCFGLLSKPTKESQTSLSSMLTITLSKRKASPAGMAFPYDFGFLPSTEPDNGDLVDALALMHEPAFPRCALKTSRSASSRASRATRREGSKRSNSLPPRHRSPGTCGLPFSVSICTILG